ncbi:MAG: hypothetical protein KZQ99_22955 [Candidatus Thiodiazotropha sp. (ex Dulcina madagascariensis)]|nr:hypothetical protein [Candidatus Thiodiazotropha sp. (ex Dulcina madagascariensis)]
MPLWSIGYCIIFIALGLHDLSIKSNKTLKYIMARYVCLTCVVLIFFFNYGVIEKPESVALPYLMIIYLAYYIINYIFKEWSNYKEQFASGVEESGLYQGNMADWKFNIKFHVVMILFLALYYSPLVYVSYALIKSYRL